MRTRKGPLGGAAACTLLAVPATAHGDPACFGRNSPCINDDALWPHAGPARFVQVGSAETLPAAQLGFGLVASYLSRPVIIHVPPPGGLGSEQYAVNQQVNATFLWAYGVTDRLELDVALPITPGQSGAGLAPVTGGGTLEDTAVRDMRFGVAYEIVPHTPEKAGGASREWGLAGRFEMSAPTGDHDEFAGEASAVFVPSVSADYRHPGGFIAGLEAGARLRQATDLLTARIGSEIVLAAGVGYEILPHQLLTAALEAWALPMLVAQSDGSHIAPAEWQASVRTAPLRRGDLSIQLGGGGPFETSPPITTPQFRFTLGVRWAPVASDAPQESR